MLRAFRKGARALTVVGLTVAAAAVLVAVVLVRMDAVRFATVLSGSMSPTVPTGSVVAGTPVRSSDVRVGDVVMFVPPAPFTTPGRRPVVHRVVSVRATGSGVVEIRTKGDANPSPDAWTIDAGRTTFFELRAHSYWLGVALRWISAGSMKGFWAVPIVVVVLYLLGRIWRPMPAPRHAVAR